MRYAVIAAFAGLAVALPWTETVYDTKVYTVTSCAADVTDCPGKMSSTAPVTVSTTCTEEAKKSSSTPVPVYITTSTVVTVKSSTKAMESSSASTKAVESSSSAPAPPPYGPGPEKSSAPVVTPPVESKTTVAPPPPYKTPESSAPVVVPSASSKVSKPVISGSASTGMVPSQTYSAYWTKTTSPVTYTGAANHVQAGALLGAGAVFALFL